MAIKSKKDSIKESINKNSTRSRIKYVNVHRLKDIKTAKDKEIGNIKFISNKINVKNVRYKKLNEVKSNKQDSNCIKTQIRTQTLLGNASSNAKDALRSDKHNQPDMGIQAVMYVSDKADNAADMIYSSRRVIHAVKGTKKFVNKTVSRGKDNIDKQTLIKQLSLKGARSGLRTARNINTHVSNQFKSDDTDLGIKSLAETENAVGKTYDTIIAVKNTVDVISNVSKKLKTEGNRKSKGQGSEYFKNKIYTERNMRHEGYKKNVQKAENPKFFKKDKTNISRKNVYGTEKIKTGKISKTLSSSANQKSTALLSRISQKVIETGKRAVLFVLPDKKSTVFILACVLLVFFVLGSSSSGTISALNQQYFMADNDAEKYHDKVELLDNNLKKGIKELADDGGYDDVEVIYIGDIQGINTNFQELFAAAAVEYEQDLTYSKKEEKFVEKVYENLYDIKVSTESYGIDKTRKIITVYTYDIDTVMDKLLRFDDEQKAWAGRLISGFGEQFPEFAQQYGELTQDEIQDLIECAPKLSNSKQKKLYDTALSIVGKVKYFWGGKSPAGWNDNWGKPTKVTSEGNVTTGNYIPFGLDCSGYVDWVYKTAGIGNMLSGGGTAYQWKHSYPIRASELQVGDLAFLQMPDSSGINHVGIYIGRDKDNNNLYAHCEWGTGVTVNGFKGFKYFRRIVNFE